MNALGWVFVLTCAVFVLRLPRQWAHFPFLLGALYTSTGQTVSGMRLVILAGVLRVLLKKERMSGGLILLDRFMIAWAAWAVCSSLFHKPFADALVSRLGIAYNCLGTFILLRIFVRTADDFRLVAKTLMVLLIPLAGAMLLERGTAHNWFALVGAPAEIAADRIRSGKVRAMGPFSHPILAGTAGAVCLPIVITCWRKHRKLALAGLAGGIGVIVASGSSGPILTTMAEIGALGMWKVRKNIRLIRWSAVLAIIALALVMNAPVYYLLSYIDLTGSSTGWHRAALIDSAVKNLGEWWLAGTDYTRHWMPTGIPANQNHTDITNVFLMMGVIGGLPLMFLFIGVLVSGFATVGKTLRRMKGASSNDRFVIWTLGAVLFGHAVTFISVDYFDQTVVLYYLVLAATGSIWAEVVRQRKRAAAGAAAPNLGGSVNLAAESWRGASSGVA